MRITYKGDYALKALLYLAAHYGSNVVTIHELASHIDAPAKFLEQVLLELKRGGFVESRRGKVGGYLLARPPSQIAVGEVVRFIDGPVNPIACVERDYNGCTSTGSCVFRSIWQRVDTAISGIIDAVTFEELVCSSKNHSQIANYSI